MGDTGPHQVLEWLARRRDGESVALIAWRDGVSQGRVRRVTDPFGPFPRAHVQLGRTHFNRDSWTLVPTDGFRPVDEDRASPGSPTPTGVANQIVSRSTAGLGLYPGDDVIQQWVTARRNGQTLASMAAEYVITAARVSSATRLHGPFSTPGPRLPPRIVA